MNKAEKTIIAIQVTNEFDENMEPLDSHLDVMEIKGSQAAVKASMLFLVDKIAELSNQSVPDVLAEMLEIHLKNECGIDLEEIKKAVFSELNSDFDKMMGEIFKDIDRK